MSKHELIKPIELSICSVTVILILLLVIVSWANAADNSTEAWMYREKDPAKKICFAPYTVHNSILKMTAQFYPLADGESRKAELQIKDGKKWKTAARTIISEQPYNNQKKDLLWTAYFRVENWDSSKTVAYRIVGIDGKATYEGSIRRDPIEKEEIVVAAFTGNGQFDRRMKPDIIANVKAQDPDLLFFSGDQVYDHHVHLDAWLLFGRQFGEIIKDRPTICIPDDHDVGLPNLWGNGGKPTLEGYGDPIYVKAVERAQTSNLPDPYDPTPIERGIGVYYTSLKIGRVDFAILEDRKFKSNYEVLDIEALKTKGVTMSRADHVKTAPVDPSAIDVPNAPLLGKRQLKFIEDWGSNWQGVDMKCVLSQTIFAGGAHLHGNGQRLAMDLDSNGWPQSGRNRALAAIRKAYAFHIAGDQHLATVIHHGIDEWNDSIYSFCVPSIFNHYPRWWVPLKREGKRIETHLPHTGEYLDGFGNLVTMHAYVNPDVNRKNKFGEWGEKADGYGIVRFNVKKRTIKMECWPRGVDVTKPDAPQYIGWPITITQQDNYSRKAKAYLPKLIIKGTTDPVIQIIDEADGQTVYTLRISGNTFRPKVFHEGSYTIKIGEMPGKIKVLKKVKALPQDQEKTLELDIKNS